MGDYIKLVSLFVFLSILAYPGPEDMRVELPEPLEDIHARPTVAHHQTPALAALVGVSSRATAAKSFDLELFTELKKQAFTNLKIEPLQVQENPAQAFFEGRGDLFGASLKVEETSAIRLVLASPYDKENVKINCESHSNPVQYLCSTHVDNMDDIEEKASYFVIPIKTSDDEEYAWLLRENHPILYEQIMEWLLKYKTLIFVAMLNEKYHGHLGLFNKFDLYVLKKRYKRVLPKYKPLFEKAARRFELDPLFLAAMAYQESHWNPRAKSPTGVKGLMMLTKATAKAVGVKNRLDPRQSIQGGAKYYKQLHARVPEAVITPDRDWFALAAYNVGMGHLYDARLLAREAGLDDNLWLNLKKTFPYLSDPKYYKRLQYGKARGHEPVHYVQNIRSYHWQLQKMEQASRD